ncbi:MAG: hypothetical protein HN936_01555, partial [Bacteroidetes bacterium]|nr:hypothetical protein [Bacteroidota bacterium]
KIYPYLKIILENPERNDKIRFLAGLYHYIAAVTYEEYPFARPFLRLVPDANKEYGYQLLEKAAQSEHPLIRTEAIYFIMKINLEMSGQYKLAEFWSQQLIREYPDNLIYLMYHLHVLTKSGQAHKAVQTLADIKNKTYTIKGLTQLQRLHVLKESLDYLMKNKK